MKKLLFTLLMLTGAWGGQSAVAGNPLDPENFSGTVTLTTDYIFRGYSFTGEDPALQGSLDWTNELGAGGYLFAGVWGTNIDITGDNNLELDFYAGYGNSVGGIDFWIQPIFYYYPGAQGDANIFEIWANVSHTFETAGAPTISLLYAGSPDWAGPGFDTAHYAKPSVAFSLPQDFGVDFGIGYQYYEGKGDAKSFNYLHWEAGLGKSVLGFDLDLRYHDTDEDSEISNGRVVFTVSRSF